MCRFIIQRVVMRIKPIIFPIGLLPLISLGAKIGLSKVLKIEAESIEHSQGVAVKEGTVSPSEQSGINSLPNSKPTKKKPDLRRRRYSVSTLASGIRAHELHPKT